MFAAVGLLFLQEAFGEHLPRLPPAIEARRRTGSVSVDEQHTRERFVAASPESSQVTLKRHNEAGVALVFFDDLAPGFYREHVGASGNSGQMSLESAMTLLLPKYQTVTIVFWLADSLEGSIIMKASIVANRAWSVCRVAMMTAIGRSEAPLLVLGRPRRCRAVTGPLGVSSAEAKFLVSALQAKRFD